MYYSPATGGDVVVEEGPEPTGPLFVLCIVFASIAFPWYFSASNDVSLHIKLLLTLLPMLLLLALTFLPSHDHSDHHDHFLFSSSSSSSSSSSAPLPPSHPSYFHHYPPSSYPSPDYGPSPPSLIDSDSSSSPWTLALFLLLLLSMLWYHSDVLSSWHPIIRS